MKNHLQSAGYIFAPEERTWHRAGYASIAYNDGDEIETRIKSIVSNANDISVTSIELAARCTDWPSLYHLSSRRSNLLRPLEESLRGKTVLEIGAGCGAITRYLGEIGADVLALEGSLRRASIAASRCRDLGNVTVVAEAFDDFSISTRFDVVTLIGVLEYSRLFLTNSDIDPVDALLKEARAFLKPGGKLIIAIENQLGMKYFAGFAEDHVGRPMFGIEDQYTSDGVVTFGRFELEKRVARAGLISQEWWYPFPDYKIPTLMVSEKGASGDHDMDLSPLVRSACVADYQTPKVVNFHQQRTWRPILQNRLLANFSNSFLLIASDQPQSSCSLPIAVHYSVERRKEYAKKIVFSQVAPSAVTATSNLLYPASAANPASPLSHRLYEQPFAVGEMWHDSLVQIMTRPDWTLEQLHAWLDTWFAHFCKANDIVPQSDLANTQVSGAVLDAVPRNMFVDESGNASFIDLEWVYSSTQEVPYIVFRALLTSFAALGSIAPSQHVNETRILVLLSTLAKRLGFDFEEKQIARWIAQENEFQVLATGKGTLTYQALQKWKLHICYTMDPRDVVEAERDKAIAEKEAVMVERDKAIAEREAATAAREAATAARDLAFAERDAWIESFQKMRNSLSWKITLPIRFSRRLIRHGLNEEDRRKLTQKLRSMHNALPSPLQKTTRWGYTRLIRPSLKVRQRRQAASEAFQPAQVRPAEQAQGTPDYIIWGVIDWHFRHQRPQQIAQALVQRGRRIFYISPNFEDDERAGFSLEQLDKNGYLFQIRLHVKGAPTIYSVPPSADEALQLRASIGEVLEWSDSRRIVSVVNHPFWYDVAAVLPNSRLVYDCMDHHEGFNNNGSEILSLESKLLRDADLTITTSAWLDRVVSEHSKRRALIRNAGDFEHFSPPPATSYRDSNGRRIIGYYGAIAEWFDQDLVEAIARHFPDCCVLLIGSDTVNAKARLGRIPNVKFVGEIPYDKLPHYLHGFDACLLPFKVIPLTLATNPVKAYEYLSAGKPIVSVALPEMRQFGELVHVAGDTREFLDMLEKALSEEESSQAKAMRRAFAREQTWRHRVEDLIRHAEDESSDPLISLVVVTYNNIELTRACLASIDKYTDYAKTEIIVVDNASSDGSPAFLSDWVKGASNRKLVLNDDNRGFAAANNQGLEIATGDYLILLNNDTHVTPGWARTLVRHLARDKALGLIGPVTNNIGNEAKIDLPYQNMEEMLKVSSGFTRRHIGRNFTLKTAAFFCVAMPRNTYTRIGPLDEQFGRGFFEDDDYCRRVEKAGLYIACAEDVFIHHHLSASFNKLKSKDRQALFDKNRELYEAKWGKWIPHRYDDRKSTATPRIFRNSKCIHGQCNVCGKDSRFFFTDPALWRESLTCEHCLTTSRYRAISKGILRAINELSGVACGSLSELPRSETQNKLRVYDTQPPFYYEPCAYPLPDLLKKSGWIDVDLSQYKPSQPAGAKLRPGITNQNLECLTFEDGAFDIVVTSDVMEHVRLDQRAHREIHRVLRPGGVYVFTVPHNRGWDTTLTRVQVIDPDDSSKDVQLLEPEYHGDTNNEEGGGVLAYRTYGRDLEQYLAEIGFEVDYSRDNIHEQGILNTEIYYCRKVK